MLIVIGWREAAFLLKTVERMLYLGYVLLHYILIYNLEVSFNFHLTFLRLKLMWLKCSLCCKNCFFFVFFFSPCSRQFPSNCRELEPFFDFPGRFELSGVDCTKHCTERHTSIQVLTIPHSKYKFIIWRAWSFTPPAEPTKMFKLHRTWQQITSHQSLCSLYSRENELLALLNSLCSAVDYLTLYIIQSIPRHFF